MFSGFLMNMDVRRGKAGRRETYGVEPSTCKTGGTVHFFSRQRLGDLIPSLSLYEREGNMILVARSISKLMFITGD